MIGKAIVRAFHTLTRRERARILRKITPPLSENAAEWLVEGGWNSELLKELENRSEAVIEALLHTVDLADDVVWVSEGGWHVPPRAVVLRMRLPTLGNEEPAGAGLRIPDLAVASTYLARIHEHYRLGVLDVIGPAYEPEPTVAVAPGSVSFSLSASGFGTGVFLVVLALSGATLPIAAPAWAIAAGGAAIALPSAAQLITDIRKSWHEGSKARDESEKAREDATKIRWEREQAERDADKGRESKPGIAELLGIPHHKVQAVAERFQVSPVVAYHLINRIGPAVLDAANNGLVIEVAASSVDVQ